VCIRELSATRIRVISNYFPEAHVTIGPERHQTERESLLELGC
jgi:hypothetical protein